MKSLLMWKWPGLGACVVVTICLFFIPCGAQTGQSVPKLVEVAWLKDNLAREEVILVDLRENIKEYWQEHIPGAVYLDPGALRWPEEGVPEKLIQPEAFAQLLGRLGIEPQTPVVAYSKKGDYNASYFLWALDYIRHERCGVLDGGFGRWKSEGGETTQDYPNIVSKRYPAPSQVNESVRATLEEVKIDRKKADVVLLDVRPRDMFIGMSGAWKRQGHMKGAVHRFTDDDLAKDGTWKKVNELKQQYETLGLGPEKKIILTCSAGKMASHTYIALKYILGYPHVKVYDGGFSEWSNTDELTVETGDDAIYSKALLQSKCTSCHTLKRVQNVNEDKSGWERIIDRMIKKGTKLTEDERETLILYLTRKGK